MDSPFLLSSMAFAALWGAAHVGAFVRTHLGTFDEGDRQDWSMLVAAALTLLGLIIGFTFSMAITRYDQRKNLEAEEANAIGTEYLLVDLLPSADTAKVRRLLKVYVEERIRFYVTHDERELGSIDQETIKLQAQLWAIIPPAAGSDPTPPMALVVSGMNNVLNSSGYTAAAWWNRIPIPAWTLMATIALFCSILMGYCSHRSSGGVFVVLPLIVAISFLLISDIDSPRRGLIHVKPQNLMSLSQSLAGT